jgi:hypothetical protein
MEKKRLGTGKIAFLARVDAIREKINAGHTVAMLHDEYKNEIGINYGQFLNYVNRYIRMKPVTVKAEEAPVTQEKELSTSEFLRTRPNKKDLLNG